MPKVDEFTATIIAFFGLGENFFGFEVEESHAHGAVTHDAFEVANASAAAEFFFWIESDGDVSTFPHAFDIRPAAVANAIADGPDAGELVELAAGGGYTGGDSICIVGDVDGGVDALVGEYAGEFIAEVHALELGEIGRVFDDAVAHDAWDGDANGVN